MVHLYCRLMYHGPWYIQLSVNVPISYNWPVRYRYRLSNRASILQALLITYGSSSSDQCIVRSMLVSPTTWIMMDDHMCLINSIIRTHVRIIELIRHIWSWLKSLHLILVHGHIPVKPQKTVFEDLQEILKRTIEN